MNQSLKNINISSNGLYDEDMNSKTKLSKRKDLEDEECKRCHTIWCMVCCCFFICSMCDGDDKKEKGKKSEKEIEIEMTRRI
jgi:hypothetical protein